ncbi:MAG TPA: ARMT1-like domain-containing protein, partial [Phototrophicaceae bacterium]|nr:ARMT1-like domain-containing protein [Phototrophicaceae bacterium]
LTIDKTGIIDFILDNTGTELATDLVLVDFLLSLGFEHIRLHVKYHPTFVSDTTQYDIISFLTRLYFDRLPSPTHRQLSERIMAGLQKRLEIHPDIFWNSSHFMWEIAPETTLANMLVQSSLVIFKGDANYRRLVDDALWETTTPFAQAVHYCPAPFAALRTMKSDTVVGLPDGLAQTLDTVDPQWRSNGKRGVIQFAAPASAPANASGPGK